MNFKKCFIAGTIILTAEGLKNIEDIKPGDLVVSTETDTMETNYKPVVETYVRKTKELIHFIIGGKEVVITPEHPFYVVGAVFVAAALLCIGTPLVDIEGKELQVEQSYREDLGQEEVPVYNFQVEDWHTYHVSDVGVLVHNAGAGDRNSGNGSNGTYEKADYHGNKNNAIKNKAPNKGQEALDNSVAISPNTTRRVGISDGEIVVFDETTSGIFHGHVRSWNELSETMKAALRKEGMVNKKGKIIK